MFCCTLYNECVAKNFLVFTSLLCMCISSSIGECLSIKRFELYDTIFSILHIDMVILTIMICGRLGETEHLLMQLRKTWIRQWQTILKDVFQRLVTIGEGV